MFGGGGQIQPYGHDRARGHDPFNLLDNMMMSPFGSFGGPGGGGMFGPGGGGMFGHMSQMMQEFDTMSHGAGGQMSAMEGGPGANMMFRGMGAGGGGGFSSQTFVMSSTMGADGQMHTEKFASSSTGDHGRQMRETQQAYSNSSTGMDKMSLEQELRGRGRKMVKEYTRHTGEERTTDMYKGMTEEQAPEFTQQWQSQAVPHLPAHYGGGVRALMGSSASSSTGQRRLAGGYPGSSVQQQALPAPLQALPAAQQAHGSRQQQAHGSRQHSSWSNSYRR